MNIYSNTEKYNTLECYILSRKNKVAAAEMYHQCFPERTQPVNGIFRKLEHSLKEYGSFIKPNRANKKTISENDEINILAAFNANPRLSVRAVSNELGYSLGVQYIHCAPSFKKNKYKPYKIQLVQTLYKGDQERRLRFCRWFLSRYRRNTQFLNRILWTDEANFSNRGMFNRKNTYCWSDQNPLQINPAKHQRQFSLNCWAGIFGTRIVGPIFYEGTLTGERYLAFLRPMLEDFIDELPLNLRGRVYFQQDGAPLHNSAIVR